MLYSTVLYADPSRSFTKWCITRFVCMWAVCKDAYTLATSQSAMNMSMTSIVSLSLKAASSSRIITARSRASCRSAVALEAAALAAFLFLMDLAMSPSVSLMKDIPCPAEMWRDLEEVLVEGPALLVRVHLRLVSCGDGDGESGSSALLERSSDP
jgi:hypothetical protein